MYPAQELKRLAVHKARLQRDIACHRAQCMAAATRLAQPLAWVDRVLTFWRSLSPLTRVAAMPLGFLITRAVFPRLKTLGSLLRWGPLVCSAARGLHSAINGRRARP